MLFKPSQNNQACLKAGLFGLAGSGKTYTATQLTIGIIQLMQKNNLAKGKRPVYFLDTETGSDWIAPQFKAAGIELLTAKTKSFADLLTAVTETEKSGSVLIIDSITHFWVELTESYAKKRNRRHGLQFQDWAWLKEQWRKFTDAFINANVHIILCGRAGFEYDYQENESGRKELIKTGVKMKAEGEMGYEPNILIHLERHFDTDNKKIYRTATVLKDRSTRIDGKIFRNIGFDDLLPHVEYLNLGGDHVGIDVSRNSQNMVPKDGKYDWQREQDEKKIVLDEIQALLCKMHPGATSKDKIAKMDLLENIFGSRSWERIKTFQLTELKKSYERTLRNKEKEMNLPTQ